jgi:hypothetical protein
MGQHIVLWPNTQRLRRPRIMWDHNTAVFRPQLVLRCVFLCVDESVGQPALVDAVPTSSGPEYQDHDCNKETNGHKRACDNRNPYSSSTVDGKMVNECILSTSPI